MCTYKLYTKIFAAISKIRVNWHWCMPNCEFFFLFILRFTQFVTQDVTLRGLLWRYFPIDLELEQSSIKVNWRACMPNWDLISVFRELQCTASALMHLNWKRDLYFFKWLSLVPEYQEKHNVIQRTGRCPTRGPEGSTNLAYPSYFWFILSTGPQKQKHKFGHSYLKVKAYL